MQDNTRKPNPKDIKMHKESYFMYEKTKKETFERLTEAMNPDGSKRWSQEEINEKMEMLQKMQDDVRDKYLYSGGKIEDLVMENDKPVTTTKVKKPIVRKNTETQT